MCDECNRFERLLTKVDDLYRRLRSIQSNQWLCHVEMISPALAQAIQHTGIGIASGLFTGLLLFGLQFTSDQLVSDMAKSLQGEFIAHYMAIPSPLFSLVLFLVSCTMLLTAEWGHFLRQKVLVPVIHGISHAVSMTTGMLLSLVLSEVLTQSFLPNLRQWLGSLLIILIVWLRRGGAMAKEALRWRRLSCFAKKYEVLHFIFPLVGIFLILCLWGDVRRSALQVADAARANKTASCAVVH
ncbi:hypothetical protein GCN78_12480 [Janthinobacterium rivuli]|uniref:hypothetical protein n=1 Tax=Janthinobacterium sp. FT68W TaxID=2654255 RepID=UPI0012645B46|nr:hypothetical protein [Janthinobacterium sp. FT68W]KAB8050967.1 hypothetical protein GCN78_12480 [Janthinobacterium sp. FT68W]